MPQYSNLALYTDLFFKSYWTLRIGDSPKWSEPWNWNSEIPNQSMRGCYALFAGEEIVYLGVGIGRSSEKYNGAGLGDRLKRYWQRNKIDPSRKRYTPKQDWQELTTLRTIGFSEEHYHLAAALEIFLIRRLRPRRNITHN